MLCTLAHSRTMWFGGLNPTCTVTLSLEEKTTSVRRALDRSGLIRTVGTLGLERRTVFSLGLRVAVQNNTNTRSASRLQLA
jgi:hypothetical protein